MRLHQPHRLFTAGNIAWELDRPASYLATKDEVLTHLRHCADVIERRMPVDERFGCSVESVTESGDGVDVRYLGADGRLHHLRAARVIKALGYDISPNDPLPLSSSRVRSVSPDSCDVREIASDDAPVWIVGSGKTAMDTVHALVADGPGREVNLVAGSGTYFIRRDGTFPIGARRWWHSPLPNSVLASVAHRFDGTNEAVVARWYRDRHGTGPLPTARNFMLGILSDAENTTISAGLGEVRMDHLVDVVDRNGATEVVFRSGARAPVARDSWIVNCSGYMLRSEHPYEPYVSETGSVVSVQLRSAVLPLPAYMGYYLSHLLHAGLVRETPLYAIDFEELRRRGAKPLFAFTGMTLAMYNLGLLAEALPARVLRTAAFDYDRWYPRHRQMLGLLRLAATVTTSAGPSTPSADASTSASVLGSTGETPAVGSGSGAVTRTLDLRRSRPPNPGGVPHRVHPVLHRTGPARHPGAVASTGERHRAVPDPGARRSRHPRRP
ncbi:potassium transporter [Rhodococcus triatomae]